MKIFTLQPVARKMMIIAFGRCGKTHRNINKNKIRIFNNQLSDCVSNEKWWNRNKYIILKFSWKRNKPTASIEKKMKPNTFQNYISIAIEKD